MPEHKREGGVHHDTVGYLVAMRRLRSGAVAGTAATVLMSVVMLVAQRLGLMGRQPPSHIAEAALRGDDGAGANRTAIKALAVATHFTFGAVSGAGYGLLAGRRAGALSGAAFGLLIWVVSYMGWIPDAGIMPPPSRDRPGRPTSMVLAHAVYGSTLGALTSRLSAPRTRRALNS